MKTHGDSARSIETGLVMEAVVGLPGRSVRQQRVTLATDHCRNALQMVVGLRQVAGDLAGLPAPRCLPAFARDLGALADGLERRLTRAVELMEGRRLRPRDEARPPSWSSEDAIE